MKILENQGLVPIIGNYMKFQSKMRKYNRRLSSAFEHAYDSIEL